MVSVPLLLWLVTSFAFFLFIRTSFKPRDYPPGPLWFPIVGSLLQMNIMAKRYKAGLYGHLRKKYKTNVVGLKMGGTPLIIISSYPLIKRVLLDDNYTGRPPTFFMELRCLGKIQGITGTEGKQWTVARNFVVKHLRNVVFGKTIMKEKILQEINDVITFVDNNPIVKFDHLLSISLLNVLWSQAAGMQVTQDDCRLIRLLKLMNRRTLAFDMSGGYLSHFPWLRHFMPNWTGYNLIKSINAQLKHIFMETINDHKLNWTKDRKDDLIYAFISEIKNCDTDNEVFNYDELLMICLDLFIAAVASTSGTLNFVFLAMLYYSDIQEKAQKIIDNSFPLDFPVDYEDRHKVPYIEAIILEVQRYYNIAPLIGPRRVLEETYLEGYRLTRDMTIVLDVDSFYKDPQIYSAPEIFSPERFLDADGKLSVPAEHLPFGLGKRKCLGDTLAKNFIFIFVVEILRRYKIRCPPGEKLPQNRGKEGILRSPPKYSAQLLKRF